MKAGIFYYDHFSFESFSLSIIFRVLKEYFSFLQYLIFIDDTYQSHRLRDHYIAFDAEFKIASVF